MKQTKLYQILTIVFIYFSSIIFFLIHYTTKKLSFLTLKQNKLNANIDSLLEEINKLSLLVEQKSRLINEVKNKAPDPSSFFLDEGTIIMIALFLTFCCLTYFAGRGDGGDGGDGRGGGGTGGGGTGGGGTEGGGTGGGGTGGGGTGGGGTGGGGTEGGGTGGGGTGGGGTGGGGTGGGGIVEGGIVEGGTGGGGIVEGIVNVPSSKSDVTEIFLNITSSSIHELQLSNFVTNHFNTKCGSIIHKFDALFKILAHQNHFISLKINELPVSPTPSVCSISPGSPIPSGSTGGVPRVLTESAFNIVTSNAADEFLLDVAASGVIENSSLLTPL